MDNELEVNANTIKEMMTDLSDFMSDYMKIQHMYSSASDTQELVEFLSRNSDFERNTEFDAQGNFEFITPHEFLLDISTSDRTVTMYSNILNDLGICEVELFININKR